MSIATESGPLDGVRVVELTVDPPGQAAGMLLADLGADVARAQPPDDVDRTGLPGWLCWNRGKMMLDDVDDLDRLLGIADVLLLDHVPAGRTDLDVRGEAARERFPSLVIVRLAGIVEHGPLSSLPGDQILADALSGFAAHHPATEDRPIASVVATRHMVQAQLAVVAALAGLLARERDGWGRSAVVSGLHAEAAALSTLVARSIDGAPMLSSGKLLPGPPNFRLYRAGDDRWVFLAALSPDLFIRALEVLERVELLAHPRVAGEFMNLMHPEVGQLVGEELERSFRGATASEWLTRFAAAGVPAAPVGNPAEWLEGDVVAHACPPVRQVHPEVGALVMPGPPIRLSASAVRAGAAPSSTSAVSSSGLWAGRVPRPRPATPPPGEGDRPLAGVKVVDSATYLAGPFVCSLFAAHGADVVKVEPPGGDPYAVYTASYGVTNEHKPRLHLDLSSREGRERYFELLAHADVVVDNMLSASFDRLGLYADVYHDANPALIRCSVTAYGVDGPYSMLPGFDPIMQSLSGLVAVQGGAGRPVATSAAVHDVATGCAGAIGTLAALWARRRSGAGQHVHVSLAASSTFLQSAELTTFRARQRREVGGPDHPGRSAFERFYRAADRWVAVSATTDLQRNALLGTLGLSPAEQADHADDVDDSNAIASAIAQEPAAALAGRLRDRAVPAVPAIARFELDDPFLTEHDYAHEIETPSVGRLQVVGGYTTWTHTGRLPPLAAAQLTATLDDVIRHWESAT